MWILSKGLCDRKTKRALADGWLKGCSLIPIRSITDFFFVFSKAQDKSSLCVLRLQAGLCCISVVCGCVMLFTGPIRESHTACRDARPLRKSQPTAGWGSPLIGSKSEVGEAGNMATKSKSSHGMGDISSCWVNRLAVTDADLNLYAYVVYWTKNNLGGGQSPRGEQGALSMHKAFPLSRWKPELLGLNDTPIKRD